jgi:L-amino acid N-acyltransferase YncA
MAIGIEPLRAEHWPDVERIYAAAIQGRGATFETETPPWESWDAAHFPGYRFVAERDGAILGWVAASSVSGRCVYRGVVESSVYVDPSAQRLGIGRALLERLIESTEAAGIWTIQAGMFPENEASLRLHERMGFRLVGRHERIAQLDGVWRDTILLERRSGIV